jgi:NAD(P)-dependent dehydrogenase (short-subunit alcohol dehydrogenase family)
MMTPSGSTGGGLTPQAGSGGTGTVVVTGSAAGIGAACSRWFAARGWAVVGLDVTDPPLPPGLDGGPHHGVTGSVTSAAAWEQVADHVSASGGELRALVNNAALQLEAPLLDTSVEDFMRVLDVNVAGMFRGIALARRLMADGGAIVNMGSILGFTADPVLGAYSVSKGAVLQLTRSAALALAPRGIRVNAVCPGAVRTPLTTRVWDMAADPGKARQDMESLYPLRRISEPDDVASIVGFLCGPESKAMTGSMVTADGGLTATNAEFALTRTLS